MSYVAAITAVILINATTSCGKDHIAAEQDQEAKREGSQEFIDMNVNSTVNA